MASLMDESTGNVQRMVQQMQHRLVPGESARDRGRSVPLPHGSAEHGAGSRRERSRGRHSPNPLGQPLPQLPQTMMDITNRFDNVESRIDSLERMQRSHAQSLALGDEVMTENRRRITCIADDSENYKKFGTGVHVAIDNHIKNQMQLVQATTDSIQQVLMSRSEAIERQLQVLQTAMASFVAVPPSPRSRPPDAADAPRRGTEFYNMTGRQTPPQEHSAAAPPNYVTFDPWGHAAFPQQQQPRQTGGGSNAGSDDRAVGAAPAMPNSFNQEGRQEGREQPTRGSPFANGADPFQTPVRPTGYHAGRSAYDDHRPCSFLPSRKDNKLLFVFTGDAKDYKLWRDRVLDHMCRSNQRWRQVLDFVQTGTQYISKQWLEGTNIDGINAWDLAVMFESFVIDWLPKSMYTRRTQIAGGEFGNGFELWRRLYMENQGGDDAITFGGLRRLQEFPRCEQLAKLSEHLDDWLDVLSTYGHELEHCPKLLRHMVLSIIPKSLESEILDKAHLPEFNSYSSIIQFCRRRTNQSRTKELSEMARRPYGGSSHLKHLGYEDGDALSETNDRDPSHWNWSKMKEEIVAALRPSVPAPPEPLTDVNALRQRADPKRKPKPGAGPKFAFKGCWHCAKEEAGHSRRNCPLFLEVLKRANPGVTERKLMKLPPGYKGAYEKAKEAAGHKPKSKIAMLDDLDDSDSDFDHENELPAHLKSLAIRSQLCCGLTRPIREVYLGAEPLCNDAARFPPLTKVQPSPPTFAGPNKFSALSETDAPNDEAEANQVVEELSSWATTTKMSSKKAQRLPKSIDIFDQFTVRSERDLDLVLKNHPTLAALPSDDKKIRKALKSRPVELTCGPDETLCLMDSGSTINAAWIEKHFPAYAALVQQTPASLSGDYATTAGGQKLMNKGRVVVKATADGHDFSPAFKDMETELPILSVRKIVRNDNDVLFRHGGGVIKGRTNGQTIQFYEFQGVYFVKLKVADPNAMLTDEPPPVPSIHPRSRGSKPRKGFARPGM